LENNQDLPNAKKMQPQSLREETRKVEEEMEEPIPTMENKTLQIAITDQKQREK